MFVFQTSPYEIINTSKTETWEEALLRSPRHSDTRTVQQFRRGGPPSKRLGWPGFFSEIHHCLLLDDCIQQSLVSVSMVKLSLSNTSATPPITAQLQLLGKWEVK